MESDYGLGMTASEKLEVELMRKVGGGLRANLRKLEAEERAKKIVLRKKTNRYTQVGNKLIFLGLRIMSPLEIIVLQILMAHDWSNVETEAKMSKIKGNWLPVELRSPKGIVWVSQLTIAEHTGMSDRQIRRMLDNLKKKGIILAKRQMNKANIYCIHYKKLDELLEGEMRT